jgi:hypothetical protein
MKIKGVVTYTCAAEVEFEVPDSTLQDPESIERAVKDSIKQYGLPEVVENETAEFMFAGACTVGDVEFELES